MLTSSTPFSKKPSQGGIRRPHINVPRKVATSGLVYIISVQHLFHQKEAMAVPMERLHGQHLKCKDLLFFIGNYTNGASLPSHDWIRNVLAAQRIKVVSLFPMIYELGGFGSPWCWTQSH